MTPDGRRFVLAAAALGVPVLGPRRRRRLGHLHRERGQLRLRPCEPGHDGLAGVHAHGADGDRVRRRGDGGRDHRPVRARAARRPADGDPVRPAFGGRPRAGRTRPLRRDPDRTSRLRRPVRARGELDRLGAVHGCRGRGRGRRLCRACAAGGAPSAGDPRPGDRRRACHRRPTELERGARARERIAGSCAAPAAPAAPSPARRRRRSSSARTQPAGRCGSPQPPPSAAPPSRACRGRSPSCGAEAALQPRVRGRTLRV